MPGLSERMYAGSPLWLQHAMVSLRGLQLRVGRARTSEIRAHLAFLLESQRWPAERFRDYQSAQLRAVLRGAFRDVPHFRELAARLGCAAEDFRAPEDLALLPVLTKAEVRGREERFASEALRGAPRTVNFTSGTTGTPMRTFETRGSFSKRWAFVGRLRTWAGVPDPIYPRRAQFTGRGIVPDTEARGAGPFWRRNLAGNALLFSTVHVSPATAPAYAAALAAYRPDLVEGYPSAIAMLARMALRMGLALPRPAAVITSAETLRPEDRAVIQQAFGCRVHDQYASSEPSCFWGECEHGVMHESPEYGVSEVLDGEGRPVGPGEEGTVVVTSFLNPLMPLVRYRLGDVAVRGPDAPCACGRDMPRIERVVGRMDDTLYLPQRGYVGRLDPVFKGLAHVVEAQIVQESLELIRVLLVPDDGFTPELEAHFVHNLREKVGGEVRVVVDRVEAVPRGANGKFRAVVSRVRHLYPDADGAAGAAPAGVAAPADAA
jgi:phenylacetate-CoA ligase